MLEGENPDVDVLSGLVNGLVGLHKGHQSVVLDVNLLLGVDQVVRMLVEL